jgi:transcriptional regulator with XRE-family HTH domain
MSTNSTPQGPTVRRRIVAARLRQLRTDSGEKQQDVEQACGLGRGALTRYEGCVSSMPGPVAEKLFRHYGLDGDELHELLRLAAESRKRGWLREFTGRVPTWLEDLVALERDASQINEFAIRVIPGLLQTAGYARAVIERGVDVVPDRIGPAVEARLSRAEIFDRGEPPHYWAILCESALRCRVGGPAVMAEQLQHLVEMAKRPHITIQVLPDAYGAHPSMVNPFVLLRFDLAPQYGVVYTDYLTGSLYRDDPPEVELHDRAYRHLIKAALSEEDSAARITEFATRKD